MSGKMLNSRAWGEGWVHWAVIAHPTGNSCLVLEAGQKTCCGLGLDFCFACFFFALPCTYGARVSLTSGFARGSSFSCHFFAPRQALSQMTDSKQGCPEVEAALGTCVHSVLSVACPSFSTEMSIHKGITLFRLCERQ